MNDFNSDLLIILKKLKYKYDALFPTEEAKGSIGYPYLKIHFTEEEITSLGIDINSLELLRQNVHNILEIPAYEIVGHDYIIIGELDEYHKHKKREESFIFTISPNIEWAINRIEKDQTLPTTFEEHGSYLLVEGEKFLISRRGGNNNAHYILKYIFDNDPGIEHFYREIEADGIMGDEKGGSTYYKALKFVDEKLKKELGINDFFTKICSTSNGSVKINPKYL